MTNLRAEARGRGCQVRLDCCNHNSETVVLAHFRLSGISGMGYKGPDLLASWACSACHAYVDTHKDAATQLAFAHGVMRTINWLIKEEVVKW
jgi:hypothetical protein